MKHRTHSIDERRRREQGMYKMPMESTRLRDLRRRRYISIVLLALGVAGITALLM